ncbi:hypothetical protein CEP52_004335 [Fusarium oligoseptatum]|uniref:N-acetyltransferase domain-containing protein n=1 Tax=Fusarium oligoseptatum TaxID=2604345 RepID=A0A428U3V6_9HYPO|nr:hypothetical protein CEP52_004335 [Fusarium oligoseptatum]
MPLGGHQSKTSNTMDIVIRAARADEIPAILDFVGKARANMFPMLDPESHKKTVERELISFNGTYLEHSNGAFLIARVDDQLVATIGYLNYDGRFPQLKFNHEQVVEVVRLYVDPALRRAGLASKLFAALEQTARQAGIKQLYLHTHPFLTGARNFWERQGFSVVCVDEDPVWQTTHMSRLLEG